MKQKKMPFWKKKVIFLHGFVTFSSDFPGRMWTGRRGYWGPYAARLLFHLAFSQNTVDWVIVFVYFYVFTLHIKPWSLQISLRSFSLLLWRRHRSRLLLFLHHGSFGTDGSLADFQKLKFFRRLHVNCDSTFGSYQVWTWPQLILRRLFLSPPFRPCLSRTGLRWYLHVGSRDPQEHSWPAWIDDWSPGRTGHSAMSKLQISRVSADISEFFLYQRWIIPHL